MASTTARKTRRPRRVALPAPLFGVDHPLNSLASLVGITTAGYVGDVAFDAYQGAVSAATYPTAENINRRLDAFEAASARFGVSVDQLERWYETWRERLLDHVHLAGSGLEVVDGELVRVRPASWPA